MANPKIKVKRSSVEGKVPAVTQLERGELAVNSYDGKVYILRDQFSVGIATTTHTINPWNEPNGVGAGVSYGGDIKVLGISTFSGITNITGEVNIGDSVTGSSNNRLRIGDDADIQIYRDSATTNNHFIVQNGLFYVQSNNLRITAANSAKPFIQGNVDADVKLFYAANQKLATTSSGVDVTGTLVSDGLTVGNYDFPTTVGSEGLVLKVASDGNLEFGSGASGGVVPTEKTFTATQGQTVFTDTSNLPTYIQVFVNGIKIRPTSDFSKSGASFTLVSAATAGDEIDLVRFD